MPEGNQQTLPDLENKGQEQPQELQEEGESIQKQLEQCQAKILELQRTNQQLLVSHTQIPSSKQHRELRMLLEDSQFQIRKMKEDTATERTIAEIEKVKLVRGYEEKIGELKRQLEFQNESWIKRFDLRSVEFKREMERSIQAVQDRCGQEMAVAVGECELRVRETERRKEESENHLKRELISAVGKCQREKKESMEGLERRWKEKMREVELGLAKQFSKEKTELEGRCKTLEEEKRQEEERTQAAKVKLEKTRVYLNKEISELKEEKEGLEERNRELSLDKRELEIEKAQLEKDVEQRNQSFKDQIKQLQEKHLQESQQIKLNEKSSTEHLLQTYAATIERFEAQTQELAQSYQKEIEEYQRHLQIIKNCYNERPSRAEDMEMIRMLEGRLWRKENELEIVGKDLKEYRLELENKEEVYTKIFTNGIVLRELKFPVDKTQLVEYIVTQRVPLTLGKDPVLGRSRKGKSLLNRICHTKNNSFSENAPLNEMCSKVL